MGEAKVAHYRRRGDAWQQAMLTVLRSEFEQQRGDLLNNIAHVPLKKSLKAKDGSGNASSKKDKRDWLALLLMWSAYSDAMRKALAPIIFGIIHETGQEAMDEIGRQPSTFDPTSVNVLNYYQARADKIATDVNDETEKQLRASLSQGIDEGDDTGEMRARIEDVFGAALTFRADRIGRTEVTRAQGWADIEAWRQSGIVSGKEWFTAMDERVCFACSSLDGVIVSLDDDFASLGDVIQADGQKLNIDYEDVGEPPLHNNCRCQVLPVMISLS